MDEQFCTTDYKTIYRKKYTYKTYTSVDKHAIKAKKHSLRPKQSLFYISHHKSSCALHFNTFMEKMKTHKDRNVIN